MGAVKKPTNALSQTEKRTEYLRGVWAELKKVHWPTRPQLLTYTGVVFVAVAIVSFLIWIVDSGLSFILNRVIG
ncbi:MAG: preprotein translocase subunit SecE [Desulfitobacterium hafniense]|nr:preprotein translocase subunit SecE [Desulfitobacterium hafniense]